MFLQKYLNKQKKDIDNYLKKYVLAYSKAPKILSDAMNYSIFAGGKRIRAILSIAASEALNGDRSAVIPVGCAIEMIHTYSLIHDDLPVMDNDDFRRGKPTNHKVFGDALAVLAGDALLTEAFVLLSSLKNNGKYSNEVLLDIINEIAYASGAKGMVGGQAVDIQSEGKDVDYPVVEYIHLHKTGAIILGAVRCGAMTANPDESSLKAVSRYGKAVGLAFQISDDLLDVEGDAEKVGKKVRKDGSANKATFPAVIGVAESRKRLREFVDISIDSLKCFDESAKPLREIALFIAARDH